MDDINFIAEEINPDEGQTDDIPVPVLDSCGQALPLTFITLALVVFHVSSSVLSVSD